MKTKVCGIYCIENPSNNKKYYGSSIDCHFRLKVHKNKLISKKHENKSLCEDFNKDFLFYVVQECTKEQLLDEENEYIKNYPNCYNTWHYPNPKDIEPYLESLKQRNWDDKIKKLSSGCWEYQGNLKRGYGVVKASIKGKRKGFFAHRVFFYIYKGRYPKLIRHICNNRCCVNPDHLMEGSHCDNAKDRYLEFNKEFEEVWLKYKGDKIKITEHFGWKPNNRSKFSINVTYNEKKLKLIEKHLDVLLSNYKPKKTKLQNEIVNGWKCLYPYIQEKRHLWECCSCGDKVITTKNNIHKKICRGCEE